MYPPGFSSYVDVGAIGSAYEGAIRPDHFRGVATVVGETAAHRSARGALLGQKDAQQTRGAAQDGSRSRFPGARRNRRDRARERRPRDVEPQRLPEPAAARAKPSRSTARCVAMRDALEGGAPKRDAIAAARATLSPLATPDYFDVVDADTFEPLDSPARAARSSSVRRGSARRACSTTSGSHRERQRAFCSACAAASRRTRPRR